MHQVLIKYIWEKVLLEKLYSRKCACSKVMSTCCALPRHVWRDVEMTLGGVKGFVIQVIRRLSVVEIYSQVCNGMSTEISQTAVFLQIRKTEAVGNSKLPLGSLSWCSWGSTFSPKQFTVHKFLAVNWKRGEASGVDVLVLSSYLIPIKFVQSCLPLTSSLL